MSSSEFLLSGWRYLAAMVTLEGDYRKEKAWLGTGKLLSNSGHRDPHVILKATGWVLVPFDPWLKLLVPLGQEPWCKALDWGVYCEAHHSASPLSLSMIEDHLSGKNKDLWHCACKLKPLLWVSYLSSLRNAANAPWQSHGNVIRESRCEIFMNIRIREESRQKEVSGSKKSGRI